MRTLTAAPPNREPMLAVFLVAMLGVGTALAGAGALAADLTLGVAGAVLLAFSLGILVATDWLDGTVLLVLAVPLPAIVSTDTLRVATVAPLTALVVFAWLLRRGVQDRPLETGGLPVRSLGALVLAFTAATACATHPATSIRELLNTSVLFALLVLLVDRFAESRQRIQSALLVLAGVAGVVGLLAILETVGIVPGAFPRFGTSLYRAALGFGQPNGLGLFLAICAPIVVYFAMSAPAHVRLAARVALPLVLAGLAGTFSRGSWLALLAGSIILLVAGAYRFFLRVWLSALAFIVVFDVGTGGALRETAARTVGDWVIEQRLTLQLAGLLMFFDRPVLGVGPGGYADNLDRYGAQLPQLFDYLPTPHNAYVQMAAETGVIGLIAFVAFLLLGLWVAFVPTRKAVHGDPAADDTQLRLALLWSFTTACLAAFVVWPFAHGTGQAVVLVMAAVFALRAHTPARSG